MTCGGAINVTYDWPRFSFLRYLFRTLASCKIYEELWKFLCMKNASFKKCNEYTCALFFTNNDGSNKNKCMYRLYVCDMS
jgi:hypothetical protein